jgi:hypothetical protein
MTSLRDVMRMKRKIFGLESSELRSLVKHLDEKKKFSNEDEMLNFAEKWQNQF